MLQSFQMLWVNVHPGLLPINFHPLIIYSFKFPPICYTQRVHLLWWTLGVSWRRQQEWSQEASVSSRSTGHGPNAKVLSNEYLCLCLQLYLSCSYNNWHLSNTKSFQFSPWDYNFMNYACTCRFLTCDRCSMGNFPNILRKPAIIPVIDVNEIFPSVYLTLPCHQVVRRCCTWKSVIGGDLTGSSPWWWSSPKRQTGCSLSPAPCLYLSLPSHLSHVTSHLSKQLASSASIYLREHTDVRQRVVVEGIFLTRLSLNATEDAAAWQALNFWPLGPQWPTLGLYFFLCNHLDLEKTWVNYI